jgi:hypothetical protein
MDPTIITIGTAVALTGALVSRATRDKLARLATESENRGGTVGRSLLQRH